MSDQPSPELFDELVERLRRTGMKTGEVSVKLGYSGKNPKRDLTTVAKGTSRTCSLPQACAILTGLLEGTPTAAPPPPPKATEAPSDDERARYEGLIQRLERTGMTTGPISALLGYSGSNPRRDLDAIGRGGSRKCTIAEACARLEAELEKRGADNGGEKQAGESRAAPYTAAPPPATPTPDTSSTESPIDPDDLPGNPKLRFDRLVEILLTKGKLNRGGVSINLGYSGWNGARDLLAVREGKCQKYSTISACNKLQEVLQDCGLLAKTANATMTTVCDAAKTESMMTMAAPQCGSYSYDDNSGDEGDDQDEDEDEPPMTRCHSFQSAATTTAGVPMESFSGAATSRFDQLVGSLKQHGVPDSSISARLGYSGKNGSRDLLAVRDGRSRRASIADACKTLEAMLAACTSGPVLRTLGGAAYKPDPAALTASWVKGDIRWRLEDFGVWVDDTLSAVLQLFFKWAIFEADAAQGAGSISRFAPTPPRGSEAFQKLPPWRQKACFVAARTFDDVQQQYEKLPDCPMHPRTFQPQLVRAREGSGDERGTVYNFVSDADDFMDLDLGLRYCLRVIAKERRVRRLFRAADDELLMNVRKVLADTYHGRAVPGNRVNDACVAVLQVAHQLIRTVVPDTDNTLRAHLGSQIAQARDRFPLHQNVRGSRHLCAVLLLRTYRAVDGALRAILPELPPDSSTSVTWRGEGMAQQHVILRTRAAIDAVLADPDVDFMHLVNALSKRHRADFPWFEVDQRGTEAARHGVALDSLDELKEVIASFCNFVTSYVAIKLGYLAVGDKRSALCDERQFQARMSAMNNPPADSVLGALRTLWDFASDALAVAK